MEITDTAPARPVRPFGVSGPRPVAEALAVGLGCDTPR